MSPSGSLHMSYVGMKSTTEEFPHLLFTSPSMQYVTVVGFLIHFISGSPSQFKVTEHSSLSQLISYLELFGFMMALFIAL